LRRNLVAKAPGAIAALEGLLARINVAGITLAKSVPEIAR